MKRAIIVHCWGGYPEYCWYPHAKAELEKAGFKVEVPAMPDTDNPDLSKWLPRLSEVVGTPDKDLYLIGHSAGVPTILRYLEQLAPGEKIGGAVFVAGFTDPIDPVKFPPLKTFFNGELDYAAIKSHCDKFVDIASDNDPYVPLRYSDILRDKLGAEIIVKHAMKHFSGAVDGEESCTELPDVVEAVLRLSR